MDSHEKKPAGMYIPSFNAVTDTAQMHSLMRAFPLATWATTSDDGDVVVNHVPFTLDPDRGPYGTLVGHVARANPVWRRTARSVFVFQGADAYISPSFYASKAAHGKVVPTWNYAVVHAHGTPQFTHDREWLRALVTRLTDEHEGGREHPWKVSDAPASYVDSLLGAIVGVEVPIDRLVGKWKVSQNKSPDDKRGVVEGLRESNSAMAQMVAEGASIDDYD